MRIYIFKKKNEQKQQIHKHTGDCMICVWDVSAHFKGPIVNQVVEAALEHTATFTGHDSQLRLSMTYTEASHG